MTTLTGVGGPTTGAAGAQDAFAALTSEEFTKIIFAELSRQDPLQPSDTKALLEQLSSIRDIQSSMELTTKLQTLVGQNELASAAGLIGKLVSGITEENLRDAGRVIGISKTRDGAVLTLESGSRIPMRNVDQIVDDTRLPADPPQNEPTDPVTPGAGR